MSKEKKNTQNEKRKLSRQERKQIDTLIRQAKGDGKPHTAQDSIPFERMYKDGICRLANGRYSKCIEFEDINYQLAQPDDKTAIFEALCDMYNSFDASISVQLSLISRHANKDDFKNSITIAPQNDDFDSIRAEYTEMLRTQLERGNNGLIKTKFLTFTVEAKDIRSARARLARIETDTLNHFKVIGAAARVLDGKQRLEVLHGIFHPDGERFNFAWEWLPASGLSVKDFIAPSSFRFGDGRMFQMGGKFGAVSFLQIVAPELSDRMLADFMDAENGITGLCSLLPFMRDVKLQADLTRVCDNSKVTDHHAILPTAEFLKTGFSSLTDSETKLMTLVCAKLLCAAAAPYEYEAVTAVISCGGYTEI